MGEEISAEDVLAPYGYPEPDDRGHPVRALAHLLKRGEGAGLASAHMAHLVPAGATLVPVPCSRGDASANLALARAISARCGSPVADVLAGPARPRLYDIKRSGRAPRPGAIGFRLVGPLPRGPLLLVDNVVATGATASAARRALGDASARVLALAFDRAAFDAARAPLPVSRIGAAIPFPARAGEMVRAA